MGSHEPFYDVNDNGVYDLSEPYQDRNCNETWDDEESYTDEDGDGFYTEGESFTDVEVVCLIVKRNTASRMLTVMVLRIHYYM